MTKETTKTKLRLVFLTEQQEKEITGGLRNYTEKERETIHSLGHSLKKLIEITDAAIVDSYQKHITTLLPIFDIMKILIKPIIQFLESREMEMWKEDPEEEENEKSLDAH